MNLEDLKRAADLLPLTQPSAKEAILEAHAIIVMYDREAKEWNSQFEKSETRTNHTVDRLCMRIASMKTELETLCTENAKLRECQPLRQHEIGTILTWYKYLKDVDEHDEAVAKILYRLLDAYTPTKESDPK